MMWSDRFVVALCVILSFLMLASGGARLHAQALTVPTTPVPQGSPIPRIVPGPGPVTEPTPPPAPLPPPTTLPVASVAVAGVTIEGATAYPAARLMALAHDLVGPHTTLQAIEAARRAILLLYRDDGYPFVTVQARHDRNGLLHFSVSEGYIANVKLSGDIGPVGTLVLRFLNHLTEERPINTATIERWLLLAQTIPGVQIQPVMQASTREPGAFTLVAKVTHTIFGGSFAADNAAFPKTGAGEGLMTLDVNSLTSLGERTEGSFYLAGPNGDQTFGQVSEGFFIGSNGMNVRLYAGTGNTLPCCDLRAIDYDGETKVFGAQIAYPAILRRQQQLYIRADFDALDTQTLEQGAQASADDLRVVRLEADYNLSDTVFGFSRSADNTAFVRLSHGLTILGASANGRPDAGRLNEDTGFLKVNAEFTRDQTLATIPNGPRISLFGLLAGQATRDILPTVEEFYLGGLTYTRGFYSGEVSGDNALAATVELRFSSNYVAELFGTSLALTPQFYGFYDWGETWQNQIRMPISGWNCSVSGCGPASHNMCVSSLKRCSVSRATLAGRV